MTTPEPGQAAAEVGSLFAGAEMIRQAALAHDLPDVWTIVVNLETRKVGFLFENTQPLEAWAKWRDAIVEKRVSGRASHLGSTVSQIIRHEFDAEMFDQPFYAACTWVVTGGGTVIELKDQVR